MRPNIEMQLFYAYVQGINHVTVQFECGACDVKELLHK